MPTRRRFLAQSPLALAPVVPSQWSRFFRYVDSYQNRGRVFDHGVASGDPLQSRVILWTRVSPDAEAPRRVPVYWEVFADPGLRRRVHDGVETTTSDSDYTVKVDVKGLRAGKTYYYRFSSLGQRSPIGRTRTLPRGDIEHVRLAVASCANLPFGYFNGYRNIALRSDLDAVLHLGDYFYEYANGEYGDGAEFGRVPSPDRETVSLSDYRTRHGQYKQDADLQEAHRQHPFIAVWDDHETANNSWRGGAENHQADEGEWEARKAAALQAYFEWMPVRESRRDPEGRIYRAFHFGRLADLTMLDTRLIGRDKQAADGCSPEIFDPERQLLGEEQQRWFLERLMGSKATYHLVGQQVMFGQLINPADTSCFFNADQWDGYAAARANVTDTLRRGELDNVVILTGDIHTSWAMDINENPFDPSMYDPATGAGSLAVEFVTPGITSPGIEDEVEARGLEALLVATHPHIKFAELNRRGYLLLDITEERIQSEWYLLDTITSPTLGETLAGIAVARSGDNHLSSSDAPSTAGLSQELPAPFEQESP